MVMNNDLRAGMGEVKFNMNVAWFIDLAEGQGWVVNDSCFADHPTLLAKAKTLDSESPNDFFSTPFLTYTENLIGELFTSDLNFAGEDETTLDNAIWNELECNEEFMEKFKQFFTYSDDATAICEFYDVYEDATVGTIFELEGDGFTSYTGDESIISVEKVSHGRIGVRSLHAKGLLRQKFNDWFVDNFVLIIADDLPIGEAIGEAIDETKKGRFSEERTWVDDVMDAMSAAAAKGDKDFKVNLPPDVAKKLIEKSKKGQRAAGTTTASGNTSMSLNSAIDAFKVVADMLGKEAGSK